MPDLNPFRHTAESAPSPGVLAVEAERAMHEVQGALVIAKRFPRDPEAAIDRC